MAVVAAVLVSPADQAVHDSIQDAVNAAIGAAGRPTRRADGPRQLAPSGGGFEIVEVWRNEDAWSAYWGGGAGPGDLRCRAEPRHAGHRAGVGLRGP